MLKTGKNGRYTLTRSDVRMREDNTDTIVREILTEKGVIKEGQKTIFDYFKDNERIKGAEETNNFNDREDENREPNRGRAAANDSNKMMTEIMSML